MTTYAHLEPYRERIDKATCPGCRLGIPKKMSEHSSVVGQAEVHSNGWVCLPQTEHLLPILAEIIAAAEQAATASMRPYISHHALSCNLNNQHAWDEAAEALTDLPPEVRADPAETYAIEMAHAEVTAKRMKCSCGYAEMLATLEGTSTSALADYRERVRREAMEEAIEQAEKCSGKVDMDRPGSQLIEAMLEHLCAQFRALAAPASTEDRR